MTAAPTPVQKRRLELAARRAVERAYAPYSHFHVGSAVLAGSGRIYAGSNVENASYGLCNCAERTAIFAAVAAGERSIRAVAVHTRTAEPTLPCGACRQVIHEFGPDALVISTCANPARREMPLTDLLPGAFGPSHLSGGKPRRPRRRG